MVTALITGGIDGMGRALVDSWLERGDDVLIIGSSVDKGGCSATD